MIKLLKNCKEIFLSIIEGIQEFKAHKRGVK
jgi:hypothetical protein